MELNKTNALLSTLDAALSLCRPHGSMQVAELSQWIIDNLPDDLPCFIDAAGNLHIDARTDVNHRTLFIAHLDTVHRSGGVNSIKKEDSVWRANAKDKCLGADDGAGVAMLMHLIFSGVPGYFVFSQGEEVGGIGARFIVDNFEPTLLEFDRAVAFDRKGIDSVITHQSTGRCCSDAFAKSLADALNTASQDQLFLSPDDTGIYTDTAEFTQLIPECTNISVGYERAHSDNEWLDVSYLQMLADAAVLIDWDALPTDRDPSVVDTTDWGNGYVYSGWDQYDWGAMPDTTTPGSGAKAKPISSVKHDTYTLENMLEDALDDAMLGSHTYLIDLMAEQVYPEDPSIAKRQINKRLLDDDVLAWAEDRLIAGEPAREILESLFSGAQVH